MLHLLDEALVPGKLERIARIHPRLCHAALMVGMPLGVLLTVFLATLAVILPISLLMGWI